LVLDLGAAHEISAGDDSFPRDMKAFIQAGPDGLKLAMQAIENAPEASRSGLFYRRDQISLHAPIPDPGKFFCVGKNNRTHIEELVRNQLIKEIPKEPTGFIKLNEVIVGDDASVVRPDGITTLDYEPELVFVIGRPAHGVSREDALSHVMGITLTNDLSAREIQKREVASGTRFWTAKNMPGFGPVGPSIITLDEIEDPHDLWITCHVNGERRMRTHTGDVIFRIGDVIEHFSRWMPLNPGDLIAMGAPAGVAVGQPNAAELYLKPGDVVEIAFEGFPALKTKIVAPTEKVES
jgi:2-keto-4-pentenoate hydratase/2-oxohepta-3-ene-1,7-dioic acid hydratase in catechol pathway